MQNKSFNKNEMFKDFITIILFKERLLEIKNISTMFNKILKEDLDVTDNVESFIQKIDDASKTTNIEDFIERVKLIIKDKNFTYFCYFAFSFPKDLGQIHVDFLNKNLS